MRKIVIMEQVGEPADYRVAFRLDVPVARRVFYANAAATSSVVGATPEEVAALQAGEIFEVVRTFPRDNGTTVAQLRTALVETHGRLQDRLTTNNIWNRYGTSWDGATWTAVTVA